MDKMQTQELISALADGQLRGEAFARGVEVAAGDPAALEAWHTYHLIGDVLRSGELAAGTMPAAFLSRLQLRLQQEQRVAPPLARCSRRAAEPRAAAARLPTMPAFAGSWWPALRRWPRWPPSAGPWWAAWPGKPEQAQLAAAPAGGTVLAGTERGVDDPRPAAG